MQFLRPPRKENHPSSPEIHEMNSQMGSSNSPLPAPPSSPNKVMDPHHSLTSSSSSAHQQTKLSGKPHKPRAAEQPPVGRQRPRRRMLWDMIAEKTSLSSRSFKARISGSSSSSGFHRADSNNDCGLFADQETADLTICASQSTLYHQGRSRSLAVWANNSSPQHRATAQPFSILASQRSLHESIVSYDIQKQKVEELGYLRFQHDTMSRGLEEAAETQKPIFHFQAQIPGDVQAGNDIFSHPLIVEAAETLFVTVGECNAEPMARAPSGRICCTRVRFLDEMGNELVPLVSGDTLTRTGLLQAMMHALESSGLEVPQYLSLLLEEETGHMSMGKSGETRVRSYEAFFAMEDPAVGEAEFAGLEGVLATRAGTMEGQNVVQVTYDSERLPYGALVRFALEHYVANVIYFTSNDKRMAAMMEVTRSRQRSTAVQEHRDAFQKSSDPKHSLRKTPMRFVPLTRLQATRANRLIHYGSFNEAMHLLSPRQGLILMEAMRNTDQKSLHEVVDETILLAWNSVCSKEHPMVLQQNAEPVQSDSDDD